MKAVCRSLRVVWVILLMLVWSVLLAEGAEETIRVYGTSTFAELVQGLGKAFMKKHPSVRVQVIGRSSEFGFLALLHKESELVMAARKATVVERSLAERKGIQLMGKLIGWESVAVICHPGVGVTELTVDQLRKIYKGDYRNWRDLGGIDQPIMLHSPAYPQSDVMAWFLRTVLSKATFASGIIWVDSADFLVRHINVHLGSIAYLGNLQLTSALKRHPQLRVQVLRIRANSESPALGPSPKVSRKGDYPLTVPLFLYWNKNNPDRRVEEFSQFCAERLQEPAEN